MSQFTFPFVPPEEDLKMVVKPEGGGTCYIFDTFCKNLSREEKIRRERKLLESYAQHIDAQAIRAAKEKDGAVF